MLQVDEVACLVYVDGVEVWLTPVEWGVFHHLWRYRDRWSTREHLERYAREPKFHVKNIRRKGIGVRCRQGFGYRLMEDSNACTVFGTDGNSADEDRAAGSAPGSAISGDAFSARP